MYFVKPIGMAGPIKIGLSSNMEERLVALMRCSPIDLEVLAVIEGGTYRNERRLQRSLVAHHFRQEWFHPTPEVLAVVEAAKLGAIDFDALPADDRPLWYEHHGVKNRAVDRTGPRKTKN